MGERAPAALSFSRARVRDGDSDGDDDGGGDGDGEREGEGNRAALMMTASCNSVTQLEQCHKRSFLEWCGDVDEGALLRAHVGGGTPGL